MNEKELRFFLEIELNSNKNNPFFISFTANTYSFLEIKAIQKNNIFGNSFYNKFSPEKIKENKYFIIFDDLKEICNELEERIKSKDIKLIENNDNLIILIPLPTTKIKEITFQLNKNLKNDNNILTNMVVELKSEINNIKNQNKKEIIKLKNIINNQDNENKKEINELKNLINSQKNELNELKLKQQMKAPLISEEIIDNKERYYISGIDNSLIINKQDNKILKEWINPNKKIKAELLYRRTRDSIVGKVGKIFHELCDNKGTTLTLFLVEDGSKGGIYTPLSWDYHEFSKNDMESFIFNLNKKEKYKKMRKEDSIIGHYNFGPGVPSFHFYDVHHMKKVSHYGLRVDAYYERGSQILPNNSSELKLFNVDELEVYKLIIEDII